MQEGLEPVTVRAGEAGKVRVTILGEVDLSRFDELDGILESAQADSPAILEIDLGSVSFMDSQGLRLLLRAHQRAEATGQRLVVIDPSPMIRRLFELSGLTGHFEVAIEGGSPEICPCCSDSLSTGEPAGDGLRPGDRWCSGCRWIVMREVLAGGEWPVECPTHGRPIRKPAI